MRRAAAQLIAPAPADAKPESLVWTGHHDVLVCTGDFIDKYTQSYRAVECLRALQIAAAKDGGHVIVTLGNHEAEFLAGGGDNKKAVEFAKDLEEHDLSPADVAAGRDRAGIGAWLRDLPAGAKVNDWFFCHAGNTHGRTLKQLRADLEKGVTDKGYKAAVLLDRTLKEEGQTDKDLTRLAERINVDAEHPAATKSVRGKTSRTKRRPGVMKKVLELIS